MALDVIGRIIYNRMYKHPFLVVVAITRGGGGYRRAYITCAHQAISHSEPRARRALHTHTRYIAATQLIYYATCIYMLHSRPDDDTFIANGEIYY